MSDFLKEMPNWAYETRARGALLGGMSDPGRAIIDYLRSNQPISDDFRKDLASAIEGTLEGGIKIAFPDSGPLSETGQYETRMNWLKLVREFRRSGLTQEAFRYSNLWPEKISKSKLEQAIRFYRQFEEWFNEARSTDQRLLEADDFARRSGRTDLKTQLEYYGFMTFCWDYIANDI